VDKAVDVVVVFVVGIEIVGVCKSPGGTDTDDAMARISAQTIVEN